MKKMSGKKLNPFAKRPGTAVASPVKSPFTKGK